MKRLQRLNEFLNYETRLKSSDGKNQIILLDEDKRRVFRDMVQKNDVVQGLVVTTRSTFETIFFVIQDSSRQNYVIDNVVIENSKLFFVYNTQQRNENVLGRLILKNLNKKIDVCGDLLFFDSKLSTSFEDFHDVSFQNRVISGFGYLFRKIESSFKSPLSQISFETIPYIKRSQKRNLLILYNNSTKQIIFQKVKEKETSIIKNVNEITQINDNIIAFHMTHFIFFDKLFGLIVFDKDFETYYIKTINGDEIVFVSNKEKGVIMSKSNLVSIVESHLRGINNYERVNQIKHFLKFVQSCNGLLNPRMNVKNFMITVDGEVVQINDKNVNRFGCEIHYDPPIVNYYASFLNLISRKSNRIGTIKIYQKKKMLYNKLLSM
jgi:hypothetical protein